MKNGLFGALGGILLLACGALYQRQAALADRLEALERRPPAAVRPAVGAGDKATGLICPSPAPVEGPRAAAPAPASAAAPAVESFSAVQREAIAKEVERQLEKRGGASFAAFEGPEDPLALLEKELGLSPAQKIRIGELWKRQEEEQRKLFDGGFKGGPGEHFKKVQELEEKYEAAVKLELDYAQQEKYAALKKEGRLHAGVTFRVQVGTVK